MVIASPSSFFPIFLPTGSHTHTHTRALCLARTQRRFASGGGDHGFHFHVSPVHKYVGMAYMTTMWLWIFYRAKQDGKAVLGLEHPWDHGHAHHEPEIAWQKDEVGEMPTNPSAEEDEH